MNKSIVKVQFTSRNSYRTTIPKEIALHLGLKHGSDIKWSAGNECAVIQEVKKNENNG